MWWWVYKIKGKCKKIWDFDIQQTFTKGRTRDGSRIAIWRPGSWVPSEVKIAENCLQSVHILLSDDSYTNDGVQVVTDMRNVDLGHILAMGITGARIITQVSFSGVPIKVKKLHVINANRWTNLGIRIFLPFLKKKIAQRIILHGKDMGKLSDHCKISSLTPSLGGQTEPYSFEEKAKIVDESRKWINPLLIQIQNNNNERVIQSLVENQIDR